MCGPGSSGFFSWTMLVVAPAEVGMASELPPSKRARVALPSSAPGVYVARRFVSGGGGGRGFVAVGRSSTSSATHVYQYRYKYIYICCHTIRTRHSGALFMFWCRVARSFAVENKTAMILCGPTQHNHTTMIARDCRQRREFPMWRRRSRRYVTLPPRRDRRLRRVLPRLRRRRRRRRRSSDGADLLSVPPRT